MDRKTLRGTLLLLLGAVIWGSAFVAQRTGMDHLGPFAFSSIRMLLAGIVLTPVSLWRNRRRFGAVSGGRPESPVSSASQQSPASGSAGFADSARCLQRRAGLLCGIFLFAATCLQQMGLVSTAAGKAGFITALYVVLVPVANLLIFRRKPGFLVWAGVLLAVIALWLLCGPSEGFRFEPGDLMLIGCAICFTGQILCVDRYASRVSGITLTRDEFLLGGILSSIIALCTETVSPEGIRGALIALLYTGVLSGAVGYTLQIIGQRDLNPTVASLLMCLESVFAVLTGALILGETLSAREALGCGLMFLAVLLAQLAPVFSGKKR